MSYNLRVYYALGYRDMVEGVDHILQKNRIGKLIERWLISLMV